MGNSPSVNGDAEVSHESFFGRMCNSLFGVIIGFVLFFAAIVLTGWNEGDYVTQQAVVGAAKEAAVQYSCVESMTDYDFPPPRDAKTLVFLQGCSLSNLPVWGSNDSDFHFDAAGVWLDTSVEMYQWEEKTHSRSSKTVSGGKSTVTWYTHEPGWFDRAVASPTHCDQPGPTSSCRVQRCLTSYRYPDSASLTPVGGACNPSSLPSSPSNDKVFASAGSVGMGDAATLNLVQLKSFTSAETVDPTNVRYDPASVPTALPVERLDANNTRLSDSDPSTATTEPYSGGPRIGDVRASWRVASAKTATTLAAVGADGVMVPWESGAGARVSGSGTSVNELMEGSVDMDAFFSTLSSRVQIRVWVLRFVSFLLFFFGPYLVLQPIALAPEIIPCIGGFIADLVGCAVCLVSFLFGFSWFLLITGICWVWYRPIIGLPLLAVALLVLGGIIYNRVRHRRTGNDADLADVNLKP